jgi:hypothetical protein
MGNGFFALDVDGPIGAAALDLLERTNGKLPTTPRARTGSGGEHILFRAPAGVTVPNSVKSLGPDLDVRGDGGQIVVWPSLHRSGTQYEWVTGLTPWDVDVADAPGWLLQMLEPPHPTDGAPGAVTSIGNSDPENVYRALCYMQKLPLAISGRNGHGATLAVARVAVRGFNLDDASALLVMRAYNQRLRDARLETWSDEELEHKVSSARAGNHLSPPFGYLLNGAEAERADAGLAEGLPSSNRIWDRRRWANEQLLTLEEKAGRGDVGYRQAVTIGAGLVRGRCISRRNAIEALSSRSAIGKQAVARDLDNEMRITAAAVPEFGTVEEYVDDWLGRRAASYSVAEHLPVIADCNGEATISQLRLDASREMPDAREYLPDALTVWCTKRHARYLDDLRKLTTYDASLENGPAHAWVRALTGNEDPVDIAVLQHWIWLCKRSLHTLPKKDHIMPVLHGKQGGGKTEALKRLLAPFGEGVNMASFNQLEDERENFRLARLPVSLFDEMERADQTDVDTVKRLITQTRVTWRVLGKNAMSGGYQLSCFIGATNRPLREIIRDRTGMRRFYEFSCLPRMNWDEINGLDPLQLWRSVDQRVESTAVSDLLIAERLKARQELYRTRDSVEEFLDMLVPVQRASEAMSFDALYDRYVLFQGIQRSTYVERREDFRRKFLDWVKGRTDKNGRPVWRKSNVTRLFLCLPVDDRAETFIEPGEPEALSSAHVRTEVQTSPDDGRRLRVGSQSQTETLE